MPYDTEIQEAYAALLQSYPWHYYSSITFRKPRRDPITVGGQVSRHLQTLGSRRAFLAVEPHGSGFLHVHSLSYHESYPDVSQHAIYRYLFKACGRTTVESIRDAGQVTAYCAKYVTKGMEYHFQGYPEDWDI